MASAQVDETGAPWPYEKFEPATPAPPSEPTWKCPQGVCVCHPEEQPAQPVEHRIYFFDEQARRMPGARCRVLENGRLINLAHPYADGAGSVLVSMRPTTKILEVEWAPRNTPKEPKYPCRNVCYVDMGQDRNDRVGRRLANTGFSWHEDIDDNVKEFKQVYVGEPEPHTGNAEDIYDYLALFNDKAVLPPRGTTVPPKSATGAAPPGTGGSGQPPTATPPPPAGKTKQGVATPRTYHLITIDWGERAQTFLTGAGRRSSSFWIDRAKNEEPPVTFGLVSASRDWNAGSMTKLPLKRLTATSVQVLVPTDYSLLRLDFELRATVQNETRTVLALQQMYYLDLTTGELAPTGFRIEDYVFNKGPAGVPLSRVDLGPRQGPGLHPLLWHEAASNEEADKQAAAAGRPVRVKRIAIDTEFVDATELWWAIHSSEERTWFLHPALNTRPEQLRVLAWTAGGQPMIWFVAIPPEAAGDTAAGGADIVFLRPIADVNSDRYTPDARGFAQPSHNGKTMRILARYLLPSQPLATLRSAGITDDATLRSFSNQIQPWATNPTSPRDPMDIASDGGIFEDYPAAFRPIGLQSSIAGTGAPHILFLPLGHDGPVRADGYAGLTGRDDQDLKGRVATATTVLWNTGAIARGSPHPPASSRRELWLAGHSGGNLSVFRCLELNAKDVSRVISISPTPVDSNLKWGVAKIRYAAGVRKQLDMGLDVMLIIAPDATGRYEREASSGVLTGRMLTDELYGRVHDTGASITLIPDPRLSPRYYAISPASELNPFLRNLLAPWSDREIEDSAKTPQTWNFLFFHEYAAFGGTGSTDTPVPAFISFFLQALGPPSPGGPPPLYPSAAGTAP